MTADPPTSLGPYRVIRKIGHGGMGAVYLAHDDRLEREVAIKMIAPTSDSAFVDHAGLRAEARAAARLNHPNIATVYDVLETESGPCIVMEYVEGETLAARLRRAPLPTVAETIRIGQQLADALAAAHAHGVVHRDVKPGNVQLTPQGQVKLLDLGVARVVHSPRLEPTTTRARTTAERVGTPAYMAPEQIHLRATGPYTDVFAAGVVLFEMLAGRRPFPATDTVDLAVQMATGAASDVRQFAPDVSPALSAVLARALAINPANRYQDGQELRAALAFEPATENAAQRASSPARRWRVSIAAAALLTVGILLFQMRIAEREPVVPARVGLAVLPIVNLSADEQTGQLGFGVGSLLVSRLASIPRLTVMSGATSQRLRAEIHARSQLASEVGVSHLLDMSIRRLGDAYRLDVALTNAAGDELWRAPFEGDILEVQRSLLSAVADRFPDLGLNLNRSERERLQQLPTASLPAFTSYSTGRAILASPPTATTPERAAREFERAAALDPAFGLALAGLSEASHMAYLRTRDRSWIDKGTEAAEAALAVDSTLASAHYALANIRHATGRVEDAVRSLRTAITLQPTYEEAHRLLGRILAERGNVDEGVRELRTALEIRPDSWSSHYALAFVFYNAGRYQEAIPHLRRVTELEPNYGSAYSMLGAIHQRLGDIARATGYYEHASRVTPSASALTNLGMIYYASGRMSEALDAFVKAVQLEPASAGLRRNAGDAYARLGDRKRANEMYGAAIDLSKKTLAINPRNGAALAMLALCEAKIGLHAQAQRHAAEAAVLSPDDRGVLSKLAAVHALGGDSTAALAALKQAIERGYERGLARDDDDFIALRKLPEFQRLTANTP